MLAGLASYNLRRKVYNAKVMQRVNCGGVVYRPWLNVPLCRSALFSAVLRRLVFLSVVGIGRRVSSSVLEMHAVDANTSRRANGELNTRAVEWHMWQRRRRRRPTPHTSFSRRRWSTGIRRRPSDASRHDSIDQVLRRCRPAGHDTVHRRRRRRTLVSSPRFCRCFLLHFSE